MSLKKGEKKRKKLPEGSTGSEPKRLGKRVKRKGKRRNRRSNKNLSARCKGRETPSKTRFTRKRGREKSQESQ